MDVISYALSKKIAEHTVSGVQSMSVSGQTLIINTKDSGVLTMTFPTPKDGVSVTDIDVNANNQIVFTMSDGSEIISGKIPTVKGDPGFSPTITENADNTDKIYKLDITTADKTFTTPNLKGADGQGGTGGDSSVTLTQEEYEALTDEQKLNGLYYIYDTKKIYKNGIQYGASEPIPLTMEEYKALKEAGAIDEQQEYLIEANEQGILLGAEDIGYNNAVSNLPCTTVQGAIDKVVETVEDNYAKKTDIPTTLPANGGNADTVNNHTVKSDVPENAVFTDTVYDDTEVKGSIAELSSNLDTLEFGEIAGSKNLVYKTIKNANIETNGTIIATTDTTDIHVAKVESGKTYTLTADSTVYAFYSVEPNLGIKSYDSSRVTSGSRTITIPSGVSYLAFRTLNKYTTPMVNEGSTSLPYEPYIPSVKMLADKIYNNTKVDVVLYDEFDIKNNDNIQNRLYLLGDILFGSLYLRFNEEHNPFSQGFDWVDIGDVPQISNAPQLYNCISYAEILDDNDYAQGDVRIYNGKLQIRIRKPATVSRENWYLFYQAVCMKVELAE